MIEIYHHKEAVLFNNITLPLIVCCFSSFLFPIAINQNVRSLTHSRLHTQHNITRNLLVLFSQQKADRTDGVCFNTFFFEMINTVSYLISSSSSSNKNTCFQMERKNSLADETDPTFKHQPKNKQDEERERYAFANRVFGPVQTKKDRKRCSREWSWEGISSINRQKTKQKKERLALTRMPGNPALQTSARLSSAATSWSISSVPP
jgi:hypothetical protein